MTIIAIISIVAGFFCGFFFTSALWLCGFGFLLGGLHCYFEKREHARMSYKRRTRHHISAYNPTVYP